MSRPVRTTSVGADDHGSALVEALVGIGMLAALVASVVPLQRAATDARLRSEALIAAAGVAAEALEAPAIDAQAGTPSASDGRVMLGVHGVARPGAVEACDWPLSAAHERVRVVARPAGRVVARAIEVDDLREVPAASDGSATVRLHAPALPPGAPGLVLEGADGTVDGREGDGCAVFGPLPPGSHRIATSGDRILIGATHVPLADSPLPLSLHGAPVDRTVRVAVAARLEVTAGTGVGRPPDDGGDPLLWTVRGDDARGVRELGGTGVVHPGRVTLVVSACRNPEAFGSMRTVEVVPGEQRAVVVPLALVTIENIGVRGDATLQAVRTTGCADGVAVRPELRWSGGLSDGMVVALPHGLWEVRLLASSGAPLTLPVLMAAGGPGSSVTMP